MLILSPYNKSHQSAPKAKKTKPQFNDVYKQPKVALQAGGYTRTEQDIQDFAVFYSKLRNIPDGLTEIFVRKNIEQIKHSYAELLQKKALIKRYSPELLKDAKTIKAAASHADRIEDVNHYTANEFFLINSAYSSFVQSAGYMGAKPVKSKHLKTDETEIKVNLLEIGINPKYFKSQSELVEFLNVMPAHIAATAYSNKPSSLSGGQLGQVPLAMLDMPLIAQYRRKMQYLVHNNTVYVALPAISEADVKDNMFQHRLDRAFYSAIMAIDGAFVITR